MRRLKQAAELMANQTNTSKHSQHSFRFTYLAEYLCASQKIERASQTLEQKSPQRD